MRRLTDTDGLNEQQRDILRTVRDFVDAEVIPVASELEHADAYPEALVRKMKELGFFGLMIDQEHGGLGESLLTYALVVEELARGWMSLSGILNTHFIVAYLVATHGTNEQREYFLPRMAAGEIRSALSMSEPDLGSDVAAIRTAAVRDGDDYVITGQKMWLTNGATSSLIALLAKTGDGAASPHQSMSTFLIEKEPGFGQTRPGLTVPGKIHKLGYRGVDTTELLLDGLRIPANRVLGERPGRGFYQIMDGIEVGRVNVAARGCGVANRAFELALTYARQRKSFGKIIGEHQAITFKLAEMASKVTAAHQMMVLAAPRKAGGRPVGRRGGHGQVPRRRVLQGGCRGLAAHSRRLRLLDRARDRAPLPGRAPAAHRRGNGGNTEDDHRPRPDAGLRPMIACAQAAAVSGASR